MFTKLNSGARVRLLGGRFQPLASRLGKANAITVIAPKRLVVIWPVLTKHEADRYIDPATIALYFVS